MFSLFEIIENIYPSFFLLFNSFFMWFFFWKSDRFWIKDNFWSRKKTMLLFIHSWDQIEIFFWSFLKLNLKIIIILFDWKLTRKKRCYLVNNFIEFVKLNHFFASVFPIQTRHTWWWWWWWYYLRWHLIIDCFSIDRKTTKLKKSSITHTICQTESRNQNQLNQNLLNSHTHLFCLLAGKYLVVFVKIVEKKVTKHPTSPI